VNFIILDTTTEPRRPEPVAAVPQPVSSPAVARLNQLRSTAKASATASVYNRRTASRRPLRAVGNIALDSTHWLACTVHDMSATGALLETRDRPIRGRTGDALPDCFFLAIEGVQDRSMVECVVEWRDGDRSGVSFLGPIRVTPKTPAARAATSTKPRPRR
jgi:hypothetical protein